MHGQEVICMHGQEVTCISLCACHFLFLYSVSQCIHALSHPSPTWARFLILRDLHISSKTSICIEIFDRQVCSPTNNMTTFITFCAHVGSHTTISLCETFYDCSSCSFTTAKSTPFSTAILHSNLNLCPFQACAY